MKKLILSLRVLAIVGMFCLIAIPADADVAAITTGASSKLIATIFGALFAVSECLAMIPALKSNSIFQLVMNILGSIGKPPAA